MPRKKRKKPEKIKKIKGIVQAYFSENEQIFISINTHLKEEEKDFIILEYSHNDEVETMHGPTICYTFYDANEVEYRLLSGSKLFKDAVVKFLDQGDNVSLWKDDNGYWRFDFV